MSLKNMNKRSASEDEFSENSVSKENNCNDHCGNDIGNDEIMDLLYYDDQDSIQIEESIDSFNELQNSQPENSPVKKKFKSNENVKRNVWSRDETLTLIRILNEEKLLRLMDSSSIKNVDVNVNISLKLKQLGYNRSMQQIKDKLKNLKRDYRKVKASLKGSGSDTSMKKKFPYYDEVDSLFMKRPISTTVGIDSIDPSKINLDKELSTGNNDTLINQNSNLQGISHDEIQTNQEILKISQSLKKQGPLKQIINEAVEKMNSSNESMVQKLVAEDKKLMKEHSENLRSILKENTNNFLAGLSNIIAPLISQCQAFTTPVVSQPIVTIPCNNKIVQRPAQTFVVVDPNNPGKTWPIKPVTKSILKKL